MTPRCIAIPRRRCPHPAAMTSGDLYVCDQHSTMWTMLLLDDMLAPRTRKALACGQWETRAEGQRLIDQMYGRRVA